ncbi:hypothetical protein ABPG72_014598 [Tetrahymena utriculariae]
MKRTLNIKKLKKKGSQCRKSQNSNDEESPYMSGNEKDNTLNNQLENDNKKINNQNDINQNNYDVENMQLQNIKEFSYKKEMTTLELQDLKIQQDLLDIADSARSKDSFGPWLPPSKQQLKVRSNSKKESRNASTNQKSSISQRNLLKRPLSTQHQYTEDSFHVLQGFNSDLNPIYQDGQNNGDKSGQCIIHSQTQDQTLLQQNTLLGKMGKEQKKQIASVKNISFSDVDLNNLNIAKQGFINTENDCQEACLSNNNRIFKMSPQRKGGAPLNPKQLLEKRAQTCQECNQRVFTQQSNYLQQQGQQQQNKFNKKYSFSEQNDSIIVPLFNQNQGLNNISNPTQKQPENKKNCYNMPLRNTLPRFLKKTAQKIKNDYNQYIKGHSQHMYSNSGKTIEEGQKKNQDIYYQEISDLLNKTINTFNFNNVIDTKEAEFMRLNSQNSQVTRYSPVLKSKKSASPTKKLSLENNNSFQNAPQIKVVTKQQHKASQLGAATTNIERVKSTYSNEDIKNQIDQLEEGQSPNNNEQYALYETKTDSNSPSFRQGKTINKKVSNVNRILLEIQQTAATVDEQNQAISNNIQNSNQRQQEKIPILIKQTNGNLLTINPHAVHPTQTTNSENMQRVSLNFQHQNQLTDKKSIVVVQKHSSQSRPNSQQKGKITRENLSNDGKNISIQFKLSYHRGKSIIHQHQNERLNLSQSGIYANNAFQVQNYALLENRSKNNSTSAVQRKISQVINQIGNNDIIIQSGFENLQLKGKPNGILKQLNTQNSDEEIDDQQSNYKLNQIDQLNHNDIIFQDKQSSLKGDQQNLKLLKNRRVLSAQSHHQEEKKRFSLQTYTQSSCNNDTIMQNLNKKSNFNKENSDNNNNSYNEVNNIAGSMLVPRTAKSPFLNYRRQMSGVPNNSKTVYENFSSKIRKNLSFDKDLNQKETELLKDRDDPQNFMNSVDAQLLFNSNALEFSGRNSLKSQDYHKKRSSYFKNNINVNQKSSIPKSQFKPKQISTEQKVICDIKKKIPTIDCKKIL